MRHAEIRQSDVAFSLNVESISGQASLFRVWEFGETTMTVAKANALCFMCLEFQDPRNLPITSHDQNGLRGLILIIWPYGRDEIPKHPLHSQASIVYLHHLLSRSSGFMVKTEQRVTSWPLVNLCRMWVRLTRSDWSAAEPETSKSSWEIFGNQIELSLGSFSPFCTWTQRTSANRRMLQTWPWLILCRSCFE